MTVAELAVVIARWLDEWDALEGTARPGQARYLASRIATLTAFPIE